MIVLRWPARLVPKVVRIARLRRLENLMDEINASSMDTAPLIAGFQQVFERDIARRRRLDGERIDLAENVARRVAMREDAFGFFHRRVANERARLEAGSRAPKLIQAVATALVGLRGRSLSGALRGRSEGFCRRGGVPSEQKLGGSGGRDAAN